MHSNFSGSTILVYGIILTAGMMTLVFEFSPYAFALLSIATFFILLINFLAIAEEKTEAEKKKKDARQNHSHLLYNVVFPASCIICYRLK